MWLRDHGKVRYLDGLTGLESCGCESSMNCEHEVTGG